MKSIDVFATKQDWHLILSAFDANKRRRYCRLTNDRSAIECFECHQQITGLGTSLYGSQSAELPLLVGDILWNPNHLSPHTQILTLNQNGNPDTIVLNLGGLFPDKILISGRISTISTSEASTEIFAELRRLISKQFRRIKSYWVGPEAATLLESGWRLTAAATAPEEYDLIRDSRLS